MSKKYKPTGKIGLFDKQFAAQHFIEIGIPLEAVSKVVDFEFFRPILEEKLLNINKKNAYPQTFLIQERENADLIC